MSSAIQFPFNINQRTQSIDFIQSIRQSILALILTKKGSVLADRNYGSRLHLLIFEQNNDTVAALGYEFINQALERETRITTKNIDVNIENDKIVFSVSYIINQLQILDNINYSINR
jgi:phage baseplate assembly protein W